jgi:hypothetical protein
LRDAGARLKDLKARLRRWRMDDPWTKAARSVDKDAFQQEVLGTFTQDNDIDQFYRIKFITRGAFAICSNCKQGPFPLQLYLCYKKDEDVEDRSYCRECVRRYHAR